MRVLFITVRTPYGQIQGHKVGVRNYIKSLQGLGHNVIVVAFDVPGDNRDGEDLNAVTRYVKLPSRLQIAANVLMRHLSGSWSLNECLYMSNETNRAIQDIVREFSVDFVVADMVRTARYAESAQLPWMLDLDDLLSERYAMRANGTSGSDSILGYLEQVIPSAMRPMARWTFRRMLRREATVLSRRELYWTRRALATSVRSMDETKRLRERAPGLRVFCMPASVSIPPRQAEALEVRPMTAVFTGQLTYQPNLDALRVYANQIIPEFERRGITVPTLKVIGSAPDFLRKGLEHPALSFLGYVPDVNVEIQKAQVFFAPIVSGSGVKTKVLEALACGVPLISFTMGLAGLSGEHGRHFLEAADATDFVNCFVRLRDDITLARSIGHAGRKLVSDCYSLEAATRILGSQIDAVVAQ